MRNYFVIEEVIELLSIIIKIKEMDNHRDLYEEYHMQLDINMGINVR